MANGTVRSSRPQMSSTGRVLLPDLPVRLGHRGDRTVAQRREQRAFETAILHLRHGTVASSVSSKFFCTSKSFANPATISFSANRSKMPFAQAAGRATASTAQRIPAAASPPDRQAPACARARDDCAVKPTAIAPPIERPTRSHTSRAEVEGVDQFERVGGRTKSGRRPRRAGPSSRARTDRSAARENRRRPGPANVGSQMKVGHGKAVDEHHGGFVRRPGKLVMREAIRQFDKLPRRRSARTRIQNPRFAAKTEVVTVAIPAPNLQTLVTLKPSTVER